MSDKQPTGRVLTVMFGAMHLSVSAYQHDFALAISSNPPDVDEDGDVVDPSISLFPFGQYGLVTAQMILSVEEADQFARALWQVVVDAREGRFHPR